MESREILLVLPAPNSPLLGALRWKRKEIGNGETLMKTLMVTVQLKMANPELKFQASKD